MLIDGKFIPCLKDLYHFYFIYLKDIPSTQVQRKNFDLSEDDDILLKQKNSSSFSQKYESKFFKLLEVKKIILLT